MSDQIGAGTNVLEQPTRSPRRRRPGPWIAAALGVGTVALAAVLATSDPATNRAAESPMLGKPAPEVQATTIAKQGRP